MPEVVRMQQRRGTAAAWTSANPTLAAGQIGVETDTNKVKIGDGATAWTSLAYFASVGTGDASTNTTTSVDSEIVLFSGTGGKTLKRATGTGLVTATSGVIGTVAAPAGTVVGTTDTQTLTNKTITTPAGIVKADVGLGNVDNTSDVTKNSAAVSLTNKNLTSGTNTFPTLNQNTTGSAAKWTTARNLAGNSVDGSAAVPFTNKFIAQGTTDTGLTGAQFLGALSTGLVTNTTTTGVLNTVAAPAGTVVGTTDAQTLTNKTLNGSSNTFSNIPESAIAGLIADLASATKYVNHRMIRVREALGSRPLERLIYPSANAPAISFITPAPTNSQILTSTPIFAGATGNYIDVIANGQISVMGACNPQHIGTYPGTITYKFPCRQQDQFGLNNMGVYSLHFYSDSDKVELIWANTGAGSYRVWVDDQAVGSLTPTSFASTGAAESLMISNSTAKIRRYRIDLFGADPVGMFVNSGSSPSKYSIWTTEQRGPTAFFFGDSFFGGSGNSSSYSAQIPNYIGDLMGWDNVWNLGIGGTGYLAKNAPSSFDNSALPQVQYLAPSGASPTTTTPGSSAPVPDVVVIAYGHNDATPFSTPTQTAATATFAAARSQWPNAFIVLVSPLAGGGYATSFNPSETTLFANAAPYVDGTIDAWQGPNRPWMTGTGSTGSPSGSGNSDIYIGADGVHPNDAGIAYLAERITPELRKLMI